MRFTSLGLAVALLGAIAPAGAALKRVELQFTGANFYDWSTSQIVLAEASGSFTGIFDDTVGDTYIPLAVESIDFTLFGKTYSAGEVQFSTSVYQGTRFFALGASVSGFLGIAISPSQGIDFFLQSDGGLGPSTYHGDMSVFDGTADSLQATRFTSSYTISDVDVVPEPASWAMMITGFALTGATLRRRKPAALPA